MVLVNFTDDYVCIYCDCKTDDLENHEKTDRYCQLIRYTHIYCKFCHKKLDNFELLKEHMNTGCDQQMRIEIAIQTDEVSDTENIYDKLFKKMEKEDFEFRKSIETYMNDVVVPFFEGCKRYLSYNCDFMCLENEEDYCYDEKDVITGKIIPFFNYQFMISHENRDREDDLNNTKIFFLFGNILNNFLVIRNMVKYDVSFKEYSLIYERHKKIIYDKIIGYNNPMLSDNQIKKTKDLFVDIFRQFVESSDEVYTSVSPVMITKNINLYLNLYPHIYTDPFTCDEIIDVYSSNPIFMIISFRNFVRNHWIPNSYNIGYHDGKYFTLKSIDHDGTKIWLEDRNMHNTISRIVTNVTEKIAEYFIPRYEKRFSTKLYTDCSKDKYFNKYIDTFVNNVEYCYSYDLFNEDVLTLMKYTKLLSDKDNNIFINSDKRICVWNKMQNSRKEALRLLFSFPCVETQSFMDNNIKKNHLWNDQRIFNVPKYFELIDLKFYTNFSDELH